MKYWTDTEFMEDGKTIELLSIGIVAEDGREYYGVSADADWSRASEWVAKNVLPQLDRSIAKPREQIRHEILRFVGHAEYDHHTGVKRRHEFWAYYGAYDWVVFCQLFGRMIDLPDGWPMYVRDVKQFCDSLGNPPLPKQTTPQHHALWDARWIREAWQKLEEARAAQEEGVLRRLNDVYSLLSLVRHRHLPTLLEDLRRDIDAALGPAERLLRPWWDEQRQRPPR